MWCKEHSVTELASEKFGTTIIHHQFRPHWRQMSFPFKILIYLCVRCNLLNFRSCCARLALSASTKPWRLTYIFEIDREMVNLHCNRYGQEDDFCKTAVFAVLPITTMQDCLDGCTLQPQAPVPPNPGGGNGPPTPPQPPVIRDPDRVTIDDALERADKINTTNFL